MLDLGVIAASRTWAAISACCPQAETLATWADTRAGSRLIDKQVVARAVVSLSPAHRLRRVLGLGRLFLPGALALITGRVALDLRGRRRAHVGPAAALRVYDRVDYAGVDS